MTNKTKLSTEEKLQRKNELNKKINPHNINLLNIWKRDPKKILWMFISAFLYNIAIATFLKKASSVASGTSTIAQIVTFLVPQANSFFGLLYVSISIPIVFGFWNKNPRLFSVLTFYWMLFQLAVQLVFLDYSGKNPIYNFITEHITIYKPNGKNSYWTPFGTNITDPSDVLKYWQAKDASFSANIDEVGKNLTLYTRLYNGVGIKGAVWDGNTWPSLVYATIGGIFEGVASTIAYKQRGSIGGSSIIANYIAYKKKKPVGSTFFYVSLCFIAFSTTVIGALESTNNIKMTITTYRPWREEQFLVRFISTFMYLTVYSFILNKYYPKYKKVRIEIYSNKIEEICEHLKLNGYVHSYNIFYGVSGYTHKQFGKIETIALYLEKDFIFDASKKVDKSAWICTSNIHDLKGDFDTSYID